MKHTIMQPHYGSFAALALLSVMLLSCSGRTAPTTALVQAGSAAESSPQADSRPKEREENGDRARQALVAEAEDREKPPEEIEAWKALDFGGRESRPLPSSRPVASQEYIAERMSELQITLEFHKEEFFVGEPLYYLVSMNRQERNEPGFTSSGASFEYRDASQVIRRYFTVVQEAFEESLRSAHRARGVIFRTSLPEPPAPLNPPGSSWVPALRDMRAFLSKPGTYQVRVWLGSDSYVDNFQLSSQPVEIKVREPTAAEQKSLEYLAKIPFALHYSSCSRTVLDSEEFTEMAEYASDPNVPLREELQVMLANATYHRLTKERHSTEAYLARAQQELTYRLHVSPDKHWLRWLAFGEGHHIGLYHRLSDHPHPRLDFDWEQMEQSYRESPPLLPQALEEEEKTFERQMTKLREWCELQRALQALDAANE
jgi:hypothetical protein